MGQVKPSRIKGLDQLYPQRRLFATNLGATGDQTLYTVPAGQTLILEEWMVAPTGTITRGFIYGGGVSGNRTTLAYDMNIPAGTTRSWKGFYVAAAGDVLAAGTAVDTLEAGRFWQMGLGRVGSGAVNGMVPKRLANGQTANSTAIYTVPAGKRALVKTITAVRSVNPSGVIRIRVNSQPIIWDYTLRYGDVLQYDFDGLELVAGEQIIVDDLTGNTVSFSAHGWESV